MQRTKTLIAFCTNDFVYVHDANTTQQLCEIIIRPHMTYLMATVLNNNEIVIGYTLCFDIYDIATAARVKSVNVSSCDILVAINHYIIFQSCAPVRVQVWNRKTNKTALLENPNHTQMILIQALNDKEFITSHYLGTFKIWDLRTLACTHELKLDYLNICHIVSLSRNELLFGTSNGIRSVNLVTLRSKLVSSSTAPYIWCIRRISENVICVTEDTTTSDEMQIYFVDLKTQKRTGIGYSSYFNPVFGKNTISIVEKEGICVRDATSLLLLNRIFVDADDLLDFPDNNLWFS